MATIRQLEAVAKATGFARVRCVHPDREKHLTFEYRDSVGKMWRVHVSRYSGGALNVMVFSREDGNQQVSLKNAIDFMQRTSRLNPSAEVVAQDAKPRCRVAFDRDNTGTRRCSLPLGHPPAPTGTRFNPGGHAVDWGWCDRNNGGDSNI